MRTNRLLSRSLLATAAALAAFGAQAQTYGSSTTTGNSFIPGMTDGYVGLNVGRSKYDLDGGSGGYNFDSKGTTGSIYTGAMFNPNFGMELGYLNTGSIDRAGGSTRAQGLNLSLVGKAPLGERFGVYGKLGTTYGWTRTSAALDSGINDGKDHGFGLSYGVGASYKFTPQWAGVVEWNNNDFHFASGRDSVRAVTVGLQYHY
ncbi:porin family protein [Xylophilus sp. GW821-FHT01B05]